MRRGLFLVIVRIFRGARRCVSLPRRVVFEERVYSDGQYLQNLRSRKLRLIVNVGTRGCSTARAREISGWR